MPGPRRTCRRSLPTPKLPPAVNNTARARLRCPRGSRNSGLLFRGQGRACGSGPPAGDRKAALPPPSTGSEEPGAEAPKLPLPDDGVPSVFPTDTAVNLHDSPLLQKQTQSPKELNPQKKRFTHSAPPPPHFQARTQRAPGAGAPGRARPAAPDPGPPSAWLHAASTYLLRADRHRSRCPRPRRTRGVGRGSRPGAPGCRAGGPPESPGERRAGRTGRRSWEAERAAQGGWIDLGARRPPARSRGAMGRWNDPGALRTRVGGGSAGDSQRSWGSCSAGKRTSDPGRSGAGAPAGGQGRGSGPAGAPRRDRKSVV